MASRYDPKPKVDPAIRHGWRTDPKSKADLLDRILDESFTGDLRDLAADPQSLEVEPRYEGKEHQVALKFGSKTFILAIHMPKPEKARKAAKLRWQQAIKEGTALVARAMPKSVAAGKKPARATPRKPTSRYSK